MMMMMMIVIEFWEGGWCWRIGGSVFDMEVLGGMY